MVRMGERKAVVDEDGCGGISEDGAVRAADGRTYFNHCSVNLSLTTAALDFGQASEADQSMRVTSRMITSPSYFRLMGAIIRAECDRYDAAYHAAPAALLDPGEG
jgi:hypothetical protein